MSFDRVLRAGFEDEIRKIAAARRRALAWANDEEKVAFIRRALSAAKSGLGKAKGFVKGSPLKTNVLDPTTGKAMSIPMKGMPSPRKAIKEVGASLESSGKTMGAIPKAEGFSQAQLAKAGLPTPGAGRRIAGGMAQAAGHHIEHAPLLSALNPVGTAAGSVVEGGLRSGGQLALDRAARTGSQHMRGLGKAMQASAAPAGIAAHFGGAAATMSGAGILGGKVLRTAAPAAEAMAHGAGEFGQHLIHDVVGEGVRRAPITAHGMLAKVPTAAKGLAIKAKGLFRGVGAAA